MPGGPVEILLDVVAQLRSLNDIEYPITFVGEGYGATVCLALAQWEPELVGALVSNNIKIHGTCFTSESSLNFLTNS
jgi:pimeloyl-ACP methyl ester carboxylesterase